MAEDNNQNNDQLDPIAGEDKGKEVKQGDIDPVAERSLKDLIKPGKTDSTELKKVKVYSPFRVYYDNTASSVSAVNNTGPFDILPGHKNFLTLLSSGNITVRSTTGKEETITIDRGVMHVANDTVRVFLDV